jgi:hypothetical protein
MSVGDLRPRQIHRTDGDRLREELLAAARAWDEDNGPFPER